MHHVHKLFELPFSLMGSVHLMLGARSSLTTGTMVLLPARAAVNHRLEEHLALECSTFTDLVQRVEVLLNRRYNVLNIIAVNAVFLVGILFKVRILLDVAAGHNFAFLREHALAHLTSQFAHTISGALG